MIFAARAGCRDMSLDIQPATILLADDSAPYRRGMERAVAAHPALDLVASCADGARALDELRVLRPTYALLDIRMPGLYGTELVQLLRDELPTIFVLMSSDDDATACAREAGAALGLCKAVPRRMLLDLVLAARHAPAGRARREPARLSG